MAGFQVQISNVFNCWVTGGDKRGCFRLACAACPASFVALVLSLRCPVVSFYSVTYLPPKISVEIPGGVPDG